jgi:hypothetical protein
MLVLWLTKDTLTVLWRFNLEQIALDWAHSVVELLGQIIGLYELVGVDRGAYSSDAACDAAPQSS